MGSLGTGVTGSCEPLCACWELNSGPLQKQPVLLTIEPSLQLPQEVLAYTEHALIFSEYEHPRLPGEDGAVGRKGRTQQAQSGIAPVFALLRIPGAEVPGPEVK